ncbi:MAG: hypothetical protein WDM81_05765 [Rhizomicrobium sp.]
MRESSLKPSAQASTSSAVGLFQFTEQTWLGTMKTYGAKHGLGAYADAITQGSDGRYRTANSADRQAILALRKDPQVSALMAGEFSQATRATLQQSLGRDVCGGELYAAHFLGPDAACRLIKLSDSHPGASAAHAFPAAADANRKVFYHSNGTPKTVREVYNWALKQPGGSAALAGTAPLGRAADFGRQRRHRRAGPERAAREHLVLAPEPRLLLQRFRRRGKGRPAVGALPDDARRDGRAGIGRHGCGQTAPPTKASPQSQGKRCAPPLSPSPPSSSASSSSRPRTACRPACSACARASRRFPPGPSASSWRAITSATPSRP